MNVSPVTQNEQRRLSALKALDILDTASEQDFDDITRLASQICDTPVSLITLVDENRQWFKSKQGISVSETPKGLSFCAHAIQRPGVMMVPDASTDDRFKTNLMVTGEPFVRFYAGAPLLTEEGFIVGTLCIIDYKPRSLTSQQMFALEVLARQVQSLLKLRAKIKARDIAEEKIMASNNQFRMAIEKIGDNVWEHDFRTGISVFSKADNDFLGLKLSGATDNNSLWWQSVHRDDRPMLEANDHRCRKGEVDSFVLEYRMLHKDGSVKWVLDRGIVTEKSPEGLPLKMVGTHTEITCLKKNEDQLKINEEKYRSIIANMNLGLLEVDTEEKILFANQSFCDMSGYTHEELIGSKPDKFFILEENKALIKAKNLLREQGVSDAYEIAVKNKSGQLRWWLISGAPRYNDSGILVGSIGIHLDITTQKNLEIDLIEAREQAEGSTRSKEVFLANMSHEIRTPMNAIVGMADQLAKTNLDSSQQFYLDTIHSASENLLFIINDILDLSKIDAGKLQVEKIGFEPKEMIKRAIRVLSHRAEEKGLSITNDNFDTAISPVLMGDPFRINQVLLNLFNNAIKFTEKGSIDISCLLLKEGKRTQTICIAVKDTGIGMEDEFVKNLFEKFSQEDASITRQYGGTGLGMSISKNLVELMGGEIKVASTKGNGTTISFIIEFEKGGKENLPVKQTFALDANMLANKKILVVDDNRMNRLVAATILKNYGAITSEAVNGQEAVAALESTDIDLVLMDIQMPVMDGMEATRIIRKSISKSLPIIALTANAIKGDNDKYIATGMNGYLSKPFKEKDLLNTVALWLNKNQTGKINDGSKGSPCSDQPYNLSGIKAISRGNPQFVEKMVTMFVEQTPVQVAEMEEKYLLGDYKAMEALAHRIRPVIDNMCIFSLKEPIREIEKKVRLEQHDDTIPSLIEVMKTTIGQAVDSLKEEFSLLKNNDE